MRKMKIYGFNYENYEIRRKEKELAYVV